MRRSWPANLIAVSVIAATIGVGALGALGSPKTGDAGRTSRGSATPTEPSVPSCDGRFVSGALSFDCPTGWLVWQNASYDDPTTLVIISNRPPLTEGSGEMLPDGWFKVDMEVFPRDPAKTFERLEHDACTMPSSVTLRSCSVVTIAGRRWMQRIETDPATHYRSIRTVVDGVEVLISAIIPDGPHAADGQAEIAALFDSLSIA